MISSYSVYTSLALTTILAPIPVKGWDITWYNGGEACSYSDETVTYTAWHSEDQDCHAIGDPNDPVCDFFTNSGTVGPIQCLGLYQGTSALMPPNPPAALCYGYFDTACTTNYVVIETANGCENTDYLTDRVTGALPQSFKCTDSGMFDTAVHGLNIHVNGTSR